MNDLTISQLRDDQCQATIRRGACQSESVEVLTDIYRDDVNMAIWQRNLSLDLMKAAEYVLGLDHAFRFSSSLTPCDTSDSLYDALGANAEARLISEDVAEIVNMFCCLFDLEQIGLRLTTLERAMCPKFHIDRVPCRLITTYSGVATEWLSNQDVDRAKLGMGSHGKSDEESGLYRDHNDIHQLASGDIALLKGESWLGNEGGGLVHRSPSLINQKKRLLLTLDFN